MTHFGTIHPREALRSPHRRGGVLPCIEHIAGSERFLRKALQLQGESSVPFDITADLEDGAPAGQALAHAELISHVLEEHWSNGSETACPQGASRMAGRPAGVGLRIHDPETRFWESDIETALPRLGRGLAYVTIPKVRGLSDVRRVGRLVASAAASSGRATPMPLHVLIETPQAVHELEGIAAEPQVEALVFGLMDYVSEHGGLIDEDAMQSPAQFEHRLIADAKAAIVSAAVRHGKVATHNVCVAVDDPALAYEDARRAQREFGFQRMWSIHPGQIEPLARGLMPPADRVAYAEAVLLAAYEVAWAPIRFEGRLHDRASYRYYWNLLERAALGGVAIGARTREVFFSAHE